MTALWPCGSCSLDFSIRTRGRPSLASVGPEHARRTPVLLVLPAELWPPRSPAVCSSLLSSAKLGHVWSGASSSKWLLSSSLFPPLLPSVGKRLKGLRRWRHLTNAASHSSSHFSSSDTLSVETRKLFVTLSLGAVCCSDLLWLIWLLSYCASSYIWLKFLCVCFHTINKYLMLWKNVEDTSPHYLFCFFHVFSHNLKISPPPPPKKKSATFLSVKQNQNK